MRRKPKSANDTNQILGWFYSFLDFTLQDSKATVDKAIIFWNWKHVIDGGINVIERHASVSAKWYEYILGTKRWARKHNQKMLTSESYAIETDRNVLLLDYV